MSNQNHQTLEDFVVGARGGNLELMMSASEVLERSIAFECLRQDHERIAELCGLIKSTVGELRDEWPDLPENSRREVGHWESLLRQTEVFNELLSGRGALSELRRLRFHRAEEIVYFLLQAGGANTQRIADAIGASKQSCSNMLGRLEHHGFVSRIGTRGWYLLSAKGLGAAREGQSIPWLAPVRDLIDGLLEGLKPKELSERLVSRGHIPASLASYVRDNVAAPLIEAGTRKQKDWNMSFHAEPVARVEGVAAKRPRKRSGGKGGLNA